MTQTNNQEKVQVKIRKLRSDAIIPEYKTIGSAGFDFHLSSFVYTEDITIIPNETVALPTGLAMEIPEGYEVQVRPRSGLSLTTKLRIANSPGSLDSDFRGEIQIIMENIGEKNITIHYGDRIAQGVLNKVPQAEFIVVDKLSDTARGSGGFGHTGVK